MLLFVMMMKKMMFAPLDNFIYEILLFNLL